METLQYPSMPGLKICTCYIKNEKTKETEFTMCRTKTIDSPCMKQLKKSLREINEQSR